MGRHMNRAALAAALSICLMAAPMAARAAALQAFKPGGATVVTLATTSAATVTLQGAGGSLQVYNACTVPVRVETNGGTAVTPTVGTPGSLGVAPSSTQLIEMGIYPLTVSVKVDSGSACNIEITRGEGMAH